MPSTKSSSTSSEDSAKELIDTLGMITNNTTIPDSLKLLQIAQATTKKVGDPELDATLQLVNSAALQKLVDTNTGPIIKTTPQRKEPTMAEEFKRFSKDGAIDGGIIGDAILAVFGI